MKSVDFSIALSFVPANWFIAAPRARVAYDQSEPDDTGQVIFESTASLREIAGAIASWGRAVLDEYGEHEYLRRWVVHRFPVGHMELIQADLAAE